MRPVGVLGVGKYLPPKVVTNQDIVAMGLDTSDEWIAARTGIRERRIADESITTSDMAFYAAQAALKNAGLTASDIDLVIVATTSPDYLGFPSTACLIQERLGLRNVGAFDLAAACSGFNYALATAAQFVQTGTARYVLVVGADSLSKWVDWSDRSICVLFGDGAGAVVVGEVLPEYGIVRSDLNSDGAQASILMVKGGGTKYPIGPAVLESKSHFIYMDGKAVFKVAVNTIVSALSESLEKAGLLPKDIDLLIPHQANYRIIDYIREKLGLSESQVYSNVHRYGNTSAASIPIAIAEAVEEGRLKSGNLLVTIGFGAGFTWATTIIRWGGH